MKLLKSDQLNLVPQISVFSILNYNSFYPWDEPVPNQTRVWIIRVWTSLSEEHLLNVEFLCFNFQLWNKRLGNVRPHIIF